MNTRIDTSLAIIALAAVALLAACSSSDDGGGQGATADTSMSDAPNSDTSSTDSASADTSIGDTTTADSATDSKSLRVMTFNVMCSFCADKEHDPWKDRVPHLQGLIKEYDADIIGIQELSPSNVAQAPDGNEPDLMMAQHPEYVPLYYQATSADAGFPTYPDSTLYFRKSRFDILEHGFYWLSPTPEVPYSVGFITTPTFPRVVGWARVLDKRTNTELYVANSHFDANNPQQAMSAPLALGRIPKDAKLRRHVIFTGDFNSDPASKAFKIMTTTDLGDGPLRESWDLAKTKDIASNTTPVPDYDASERIDHIFVGTAFSVSRWVVDMKRFGPKSRYPSDHFMIVADLRL